MKIISTRDWKSSFERWAQPPSKTEQDRCANAESMIKKAIQSSEKLKSRGVSVFTQGSYANRTNVRANSDVDIAVACGTLFYYDLPEGVNHSDYGIVPSSYSYPEFKDDVGEALVSYFGTGAITRGNKAFDIKATSYHVEADVAPFVDYRQYFGRSNHRDGYVLYPDKGTRIENYPHQHYANGISKNTITNQRFKRVVRILKAVCYEMQDNNTGVSKRIPGFLIECLAGLTPGSQYANSDLTISTGNVIAWLYNNTTPESDCSEWAELNDIKYLFRASQPWSKEDTHQFMLNLWQYIGFSNS